MSTKMDQADYQSEIAALATEANTLETTLRGAGKSFPARPAKSDDLLADHAALVSHVAALKASQSAPVTPNAATAPARKLTLTETCLAANGVKPAAEPAKRKFIGKTAECLAAKGLAAVVLVLFAMICAAHAQGLDPRYVAPGTPVGANVTLNGGTNNVGPSSTNFYDGSVAGAPSTVLQVYDYDYIGLGISFTGSNGATSPVTFRIKTTCDMSFWDTTPQSIALIQNGTNVVCTNVFFDVHGRAGIEVSSVECPASYASNLVITWGVKRNKVTTVPAVTP
jgi:hypothetical protein